MNSLMLAHTEDRHDVGVVQQGRDPRLALEPKQLDRRRQSIARQDLECDAATEALLHGLVNDPHAAPANLADDPVVAQPLKHGPIVSRTARIQGRRIIDPGAELLHHHQRRE